MGRGIKLETGSYVTSHADHNQSINLQPGSGHVMPGGDACYANLGLNVYINKITVGGTLQLKRL